MHTTTSDLETGRPIRNALRLLDAAMAKARMGLDSAADLEGAIRAFDASLERQPTGVFARINRAMARIRLAALVGARTDAGHRHIARALWDLDAALDAIPSLGIALLNRGIAHRMLGHIDLAVLDWRRAAELRPDLSVHLKALIQRSFCGSDEELR